MFIALSKYNIGLIKNFPTKLSKQEDNIQYK